MSDTHIHDREPSAVLREHGFRATDGRARLLLLLRKSAKPLSIQEIRALWKNALNQVTLYRMLADLAEAGIVRRVDLNTGVARFEYTPDKPHHHHVVCTGCGEVEDVKGCPLQEVQRSKNFKSAYSHNLEFFSVCRSCAN